MALVAAFLQAGVVELVDTQVLEACALRVRVRVSPPAPAMSHGAQDDPGCAVPESGVRDFFLTSC